MQAAPPPTPGPPQRMTVAARSIIGTYPGKAANQDSFVMQPLQPLRASGGGSSTFTRSPFRPPPTAGAESPERRGGQSFEDELTVAAGGDAIVGVYDGHGQHGHHVSKFVKVCPPAAS